MARENVGMPAHRLGVGHDDKVRAEVQIGDEIKESSIENKLQAIRQQSGSAKAQARLAALKAQRGQTEDGGKTL